MQKFIRCRVPLLGSGYVEYNAAHQLYGAICRIEPAFHNHEEISISPIENALTVNNGLQLVEKTYFWVQCPITDLGLVYRLAGKRIVLGDNNKIRLGIPRPKPIYPSNQLVSRYVIVKNKVEPDLLKEHIRKQLHRLNRSHESEEDDSQIDAIHIDIMRRRVVQIHQYKMVGFGVRLRNLTDRMSLLVQTYSVSGRRRFGSGFFVPFQSGDSYDDQAIISQNAAGRAN